jgi:hypothetical protein
MNSDSKSPTVNDDRPDVEEDMQSQLEVLSQLSEIAKRWHAELSKFKGCVRATNRG